MSSEDDITRAHPADKEFTGRRDSAEGLLRIDGQIRKQVYSSSGVGVIDTGPGYSSGVGMMDTGPGYSTGYGLRDASPSSGYMKRDTRGSQRDPSPSPRYSSRVMEFRSAEQSTTVQGGGGGGGAQQVRDDYHAGPLHLRSQSLGHHEYSSSIEASSNDYSAGLSAYDPSQSPNQIHNGLTSSTGTLSRSYTKEEISSDTLARRARLKSKGLNNTRGCTDSTPRVQRLMRNSSENTLQNRNHKYSSKSGINSSSGNKVYMRRSHSKSSSSEWMTDPKLVYEEDDDDVKCTGCFEKFPRCFKISPDDKEEMIKENSSQNHLEILEKHYNLKLDDNMSGRMNIIDSNLSTCVLFLSILVLLLLLTFLTFRLSTRVESLESVCSSLSDYIHEKSENKSDTTNIEGENPSIYKGKRRSRSRGGNS